MASYTALPEPMLARSGRLLVEHRPTRDVAGLEVAVDELRRRRRGARGVIAGEGGHAEGDRELPQGCTGAREPVERGRRGRADPGEGLSAGTRSLDLHLLRDRSAASG